MDAVFVPVARCQTADRAEGVDERCRCEAGVLGNGELEQFAGAVVIKQRGDIELVEGRALLHKAAHWPSTSRQDAAGWRQGQVVRAGEPWMGSPAPGIRRSTYQVRRPYERLAV